MTPPFRATTRTSSWKPADTTSTIQVRPTGHTSTASKLRMPFFEMETGFASEPSKGSSSARRKQHFPNPFQTFYPPPLTLPPQARARRISSASPQRQRTSNPEIGGPLHSTDWPLSAFYLSGQP